MEDLLGIGKALPTNILLKVASQACGRVTKAYYERKDAKTKAFEIKLLGKAKTEAKVEEITMISKAIQDNCQITGGIEYKDGKVEIHSPKELISYTEALEENTPLLEKRTQDRFLYQQAMKQLNIENVVSFAAEELKDEPPIKDEPINEDWTTRFFNIVEDISEEEMQAMWGRILAGEIKRPKSFSLRTLELLKNLTKEEAEVFTKFAHLNIVIGDDNCIFNQDKGIFLEQEFGITFKDILLLTELGLIASKDNLELSFPETNEEKTINSLIYGKKCIVFIRDGKTPKQSMQVLMFTKIGSELSKLIIQDFNINYMNKIYSNFKHPNVEIKYGDFISITNGKLKVNNLIEFN